MLKIKLFQKGKTNQRTYRIVIAEAKSKRDGYFVDDLGSWDPKTRNLRLDVEKLKKWQEKGAQLTEGVRKILAQQNK